MRLTKTRLVAWLMFVSILSSAFAASVAPIATQSTPPELLTIAERSDFTATARYDEVVSLCDRLAELSPKYARRVELGLTEQGRIIPLLILADPPVENAEQAAKSGKMVVLLIGNIHAGEVCGKEALPMLARELLGLDGDAASDDQKDPAKSPKASDLLKDLIIVMAPIYNADGNENVGPLAQRRPGQVGPEGGDGVGTRENSDGLDLNRDFVKLEATETRSLVRFMSQWDPAVVVDTHTTNGSLHRHTITYAGPTHPAGDAKVLTYVRDEMLPSLVKSMEGAHGVSMFHYGNFEKDHTVWTTYPDLPRYGIPYIGLRNRIGILSEAYSYAPFKDRVLATRDMCREVLVYTAAQKDEIRKLEREADARVVAAGAKPSTDDVIHLRTEAVAFPNKAIINGFIEEVVDGKHVSTGQPKDYQVDFINDFRPTLSVRRPFAYLIPAEHDLVIQTLQQHGIRVDELREDLDIDVEAYKIDTVTTTKFPFQNHTLVDVGATAEPRTKRVAAGTFVVREAQPLGTLACYLIEPRSSDGLTAWNFFDDALTIGDDFPITRMVEPRPLLTAPARLPHEFRQLDKPLSYKALYESPAAPNFSGSPLGGLRWVPVATATPPKGNSDSPAASSPTDQNTPSPDESYFQARDGVLYKVSALTGRSEKALDLTPMKEALAGLPTIGEHTAGTLVGPFMSMNADRTAAVFEFENDLYYATVDGHAGRLTSTPEPEEQFAFSPDGRFVAFIRSNDLWVVDVRTHTERALTTGGTDLIRNGKNDWVYHEELFNRNWRAYWWSPDSKRLALLQVDSTPVPRFKLQADHAEPRVIEDAPYPEPGEPNPNVKLGIVTASGGAVRWADLSDYNAGHFLITGVGWIPADDASKESKAAFCYVQDRTQTWLDLLSVPTSGAKPTRLLRDSTKAWVEPLGDPKFLKDGSFILASERSGFRHLYLFDRKGELRNPITQGDWEATSIQHIDEKLGLVYFMSTQDGSITSNLYRVKLDGSELTRLTFPFVECEEPPRAPETDPVATNATNITRPFPGGMHAVQFSPSGNYFIDSWSDHQHPTQVALFRNTGARVRTLDSNPVYAPEEYERGSFELTQIPTRDGFLLEASILLPPGFDPTHKYPVWLQTYAGPHAPTVFDSWQGGRLGDEALAREGIIVFRTDPRSASGKGAQSAWTAYKQLGVQELADLEDAVKWLGQREYVDSTRVGISGGSYGGFITVFALTHSKVFSAGVAVASPTDWRDYDSIYTERYMGLPQDNPDGYDKTSVVKAAKNLHGRLLLVHGTMDDNVHMLNSIKLTRALQAANKQFEFMLYPGSRHGVGGGHYRAMFFDFIRRTFDLHPQDEATPNKP